MAIIVLIALLLVVAFILSTRCSKREKATKVKWIQQSNQTKSRPNMNGFLFVSAYLNVCYLYGFQIYVVDYQKRHNGRENNQSYKSDTFG